MPRVHGAATVRRMNRILIASMPAAGHVGPLVPLAAELADRGHDVAWYTGIDYRDKVEATGARFFPHVEAPDRDASKMDPEFPERAQLKGIAKFKFDIRKVFIAAVPGQVADIEAILEVVRPDVIVAEPGMAAAAKVIEQRHGIPWATCGITAFAMKSVDTAPFGLGLKPSASPLGRVRNRALHALTDRTLYRPIDRDYHAMRATLGMEPSNDGVFDVTCVAAPVHPADRAVVRVPAPRPPAAGALRRPAAAARAGRVRRCRRGGTRCSPTRARSCS